MNRQSLTTKAYNVLQRLPRGEQASLRRGSHGSAALWRIMHDIGEINGDAELWRSFLVALVHSEGHDPQTSFGKALAKAGWSEVRLVRLLEADCDTLKVMLRRCAQYLKSKRQAANWNHARQLLFYDRNGEDYAEDIRLRISRDYYRTLYEDEKN